MFNNSKFTTVYYNLVDKAKSRPASSDSIKHYIVPLDMGGIDDESNIVFLTTQEKIKSTILLERMVDVNPALIQDYIDKNPGVYRIGKLNFSDLELALFEYKHLTSYSRKDIAELPERYVNSNNPDWDIIGLCVASYMSAEQGASIQEQVSFRKRPTLLSFPKTDETDLKALRIEPGFHRTHWAKAWGFKTCDFLICDFTGNFEHTLPVTNVSQIIQEHEYSENYIEWCNSRTKRYFQLGNNTAWQYIHNAVPRLLNSWHADNNCFSLIDKVGLTDQQVCMIEVLADVNCKKVYGNGWELVNNNPVSGETYYNYPRI